MDAKERRRAEQAANELKALKAEGLASKPSKQREMVLVKPANPAH